MNKNYGEKLLADNSSHATLWAVLTKIDADLAVQACAQGCPHCEGALHRADYPRKVRGVNVEARRDSFCCAEEGCRRRMTPGSVRFLGRRIYAGFIVVLLTALRHGLVAERVAVLQEHLGVDRRTLARWRAWWLQHFAQGRSWRAARGRFWPAPDEATLPWSLWLSFGDDGGKSLLDLLRFLTPWSTRPAPGN
ncbi:MAG TPA: hypothetical protein PK406_13680 [Verrucomicrobiota bacterium]|nr:hypothetical protein [Verrucomicrobiota bacterium]